MASGANRYDAHDIAKWEFKEGTGSTAYDTSGVDPGMDLTLSGDAGWVGGWGITFTTNGRAQASTATSSKLYNKLNASGQYSVELWVNAANVTQTKAYSSSYSGGDTLRNFTLAQDAFQYEAFARSSATSLNGSPSLLPTPTTAGAGCVAACSDDLCSTTRPQAVRQRCLHRRFDRSTGGTINSWDNSFAFLLGNETSGDHPWQGSIALCRGTRRGADAATDSAEFRRRRGRQLLPAVRCQRLINTPQSYIMFTASQYDSYSYLFARPTFINLNPSFMPTSPIPIQGIRIGVNGAEVPVDQAYSHSASRLTHRTTPRPTVSCSHPRHRNPAGEWSGRGRVLPDLRQDRHQHAHLYGRDAGGADADGSAAVVRYRCAHVQRSQRLHVEVHARCRR